MPKMKIVTDAMLDRANKIGQNTSNILEKQNMVTDLFKNMGKSFSGKIPSLMTQHILAMDKEYQTMNGILSNYKNFLEDAANNYEWKEEELARMVESLGGTKTNSGNTSGSVSAGINSGTTGTTVTAGTSAATNITNEEQNTSSYQEPIYSAPTTPVATQTSDKWGWNTENLPFDHNTPDLSSNAYNRSNSEVLVNTRELYNSWAKEDRVNCVYYARARYLEINGEQQYHCSFDYNSESIKNGNCVVRFNGHSVYVEHYDAENDVVWFSDSNMGSHPDGALQSKSFDDFKNFSGGFQYVEAFSRNP